MLFQSGRLTTNLKWKDLVYSSQKKVDDLLVSSFRWWNWSFLIKLWVVNLTISESPKKKKSYAV